MLMRLAGDCNVLAHQFQLLVVYSQVTTQLAKKEIGELVKKFWFKFIMELHRNKLNQVGDVLE